MAAFEATQSPDGQLQGFPGQPSDKVVIVKAFGTFPSAHRVPPGVNADASTIVAVYDVSLGEVVATGYLTGAEPTDITGAAAGVSPTGLDLRTLGTPARLQP
jgi:hypothetical protein